MTTLAAQVPMCSGASRNPKNDSWSDLCTEASLDLTSAGTTRNMKNHKALGVMEFSGKHSSNNSNTQKTTPVIWRDTFT